MFSRCADVWPEVVTVDRATHPSRSFYYTFVSIVLYFFPIVIMSFAYCFIILKLSQRPPGEYVDSDACVQIKVKRKVIGAFLRNVLIKSSLIQHANVSIETSKRHKQIRSIVKWYALIISFVQIQKFKRRKTYKKQTKYFPYPKMH